MKRIAVDLHYLPTLEWFSAIIDAEEILLFLKDQYQRQSYYNRTRILLANKVETLSIPIQGRRPRLPLDQIKIDNSQKWQAVHLRGIQSAYGKAPFFEFFFPYFQPVFENQPESLWEFNSRLLTICLKLLQWPVKVSVGDTSALSLEIEDQRRHIAPSRPFSERNFYQPIAYPQLFGLDFEPNLSILDLLFCMGPEAGNVLKSSAKKE
ncbi:WbqC family protein [Algoriphagus taiwanensis]|uniref:WbqC family protein n=1 Tax=Algoriphagus taiwanensis TaxID=1445656 RepID=A0ABQ6PZB8_9BACT|nr:WbqC family protein [Algoriphagus taiwanensis]